jgi:hypothetical protein
VSGGVTVVGQPCLTGGVIGGILSVYRQVLTRRFPAMALSKSVVAELLEAFRAGEGVGLIRESVRLVMQELIETKCPRTTSYVVLRTS